MSRLFVEQLTVIDCAYLDAARGLVGESWIVDIEIEGALDAQSMVLDFSDVKHRCKQAIDAHIDHRLLIPMQAPELDLQDTGDGLHLVFRSDLGVIDHLSPECALARLPLSEINAEGVARQLEPVLMTVMPPTVAAVHLTLRNEAIDGAYYHYVHGLKKHDGACQRIAHGHRSRIEVRVDGFRDTALERVVAGRWLDVYLGTREDIVSQADGRVRFAYRSPEGHYQIALPERQVDLLDSDTTVECIADHLAAVLAPLRPGATVSVRAYEGVNKGAVGQRSAGPDAQ